MGIDISFDVRSDVPLGADPDKYSKTLKQYHKILWSKPLPSGRMFLLDDTVKGKYLCHNSELGNFSLSSDGIVHSLVYVKRMHHIISQLNEEQIERILRKIFTIGSFTLFPANRIDGRMTINGVRGCNARICDRFDLTLECIRRHYIGITSPLTDVLARYKNFFSLFEDFHGYVGFFLLQDLLNENKSEIRFFLPFDNRFPTQPLPQNIQQYKAFIARQTEFLSKRARRMRLQ
jgi:hypothetical protein